MERPKASNRPNTSATLAMGGFTTDKTTPWMTNTVDTMECDLNALVAKMVRFVVVWPSNEVA